MPVDIGTEQQMGFSNRTSVHTRHTTPETRDTDCSIKLKNQKLYLIEMNLLYLFDLNAIDPTPDSLSHSSEISDN